jgi:hypothetical protein
MEVDALAPGPPDPLGPPDRTDHRDARSPDVAAFAPDPQATLLQVVHLCGAGETGVYASGCARVQQQEDIKPRTVGDRPVIHS